MNFEPRLCSSLPEFALAEVFRWAAQKPKTSLLCRQARQGREWREMDIVLHPDTLWERDVLNGQALEMVQEGNIRIKWSVNTVYGGKLGDISFVVPWPGMNQLQQQRGYPATLVLQVETCAWIFSQWMRLHEPLYPYAYRQIDEDPVCGKTFTTWAIHFENTTDPSKVWTPANSNVLLVGLSLIDVPVITID